MGQPAVITKALTAAADNNICASQTPGAAGNLLINGSLAAGGVATLDSQRRVIITSGGNDTGVTFTVIGTNDDGSPIKDSFLGASGGVAASNIDFKTVTQVSASAAPATTVKVGTNTTGSSPWKLFDSHLDPSYLSLSAQLVSGSGTASVEYTYDEFLPGTGLQADTAKGYGANTPNPVALPHAQLQGLTASNDGAIDYPIRGWRLTITLGTGTWKLTGTQSGVAGP